jgi:hypothetical protein
VSLDITPPSSLEGQPGAYVAAALLLAGAVLQLVGAYRLRGGEPRTTIGRQLVGGFGPRGAVVFLVVLGVGLLAASAWVARLAAR